MTLARHVAAERHEHSRPEPELLGAEECRDHYVPPAAQAAIGPQAHAFAQAVGDEHLLRLRQAELPRNAGVLDR